MLTIILGILEADKYVQNTDEAYKKIKLALEKTQSKQKKAVDRHRRELVFSLGDWVLLRFEKAWLRKMKGKERLFPKLVSVIMDLFKPFVDDMPEDMVPEEQPEVEELEEILLPEQILAHKDRKVRGKVVRRYLVKFKNYSRMDAKWMEEDELKEEAAHQHQFILHAALDIVQDLAWTTNATFLKSVDKFNDLTVSVYVTAGRTKLMLLHDSRNEDGIRNFFQEVYELYIKILLNPLYIPGSRIMSPYFDTRVRALARKYL
ncbi:hypothetical protein L7F22_056883 [Adiantum nelumboides]|nr:hypothetical protein [Adiantum nelumboides]